MRALIVQRNDNLGLIWQRHLARLEVETTCVQSAEAAVDLVRTEPFDVVVLDIEADDGGALTVADLLQFRQPDANIVFVTNTTFFSDGSIFRHVANARALLKTATPPKDLAAIIHHYGLRSPGRAAHRCPVPG